MTVGDAFVQAHGPMLTQIEGMVGSRIDLIIRLHDTYAVVQAVRPSHSSSLSIVFGHSVSYLVGL